MADWSALVSGFQKGADFSQDFRARKQLEKYRDYGLEGMDYDMQARRASRKAVPPGTEDLAAADPASMQDWGGQLQDPFAYKMLDWFKKKVGKKKAAIDTGASAGMSAGEITPTGSVSAKAPPAPAAAQTYSLGDEEEPSMGEAYADGGEIDDDVKKRAARNRASRPGRVESSTESVRGADRTAKAAKEALPLDEKPGLGRRLLNSKAGKLGMAGALGATALSTADTSTEDYRKRFGLETDDPSLAGDVGIRALGAASDLGNALTFGAAGRLYRDKQEAAAPAAPPVESPAAPTEEAPQEALPMSTGAGMPMRAPRASALPTSRGPKAEVIDFSGMDIDPKEVPDMKTDDWVRYRTQLMDAARRSGNPQAVAQAQDQVTHMQQEGFLNYAKQGFALMQGGNARGAMSAFRAAYQYFPNGYDVEFGVHKGKIIGFGKDEKTGKVAPGTEMVMDPERVATLIENFKNPEAFRMWTKDWRDQKFKERKYEETEKPLAQAQADALATNSEANVVRAENAGLRARLGAGGVTGGGGGNDAGMRNAERTFRTRLQMLGMEDEVSADHLASLMSQIKAQNPQTPDNTIIEGVMRSYKDGTLDQRLKKMGIGTSPAAPVAAPQSGASALPIETDTPTDETDTTANPYINRRALADINQKY